MFAFEIPCRLIGRTLPGVDPCEGIVIALSLHAAVNLPRLDAHELLAAIFWGGFATVGPACYGQ
jgi:hypothetical protein